MKPESLQQIGLSKNESKIYLVLLRNGSLNADQIARGTGVHRRNVYDSLDRLLNRGLITKSVSSSGAQFGALDPSMIKGILQEARDSIAKKEAALLAILPELTKMRTESGKPLDVSIFQGKAGIAAILDKIIKEGKPNHVIGGHASPQFSLILARFHKTRIKAGVIDKIIFKKEDAKRASKLAKMPYTFARVLPDDHESPIAINIFGENVALLIQSDQSPLGILIHSKDTARGFMEYFEMIWGMCKTVN